MNKTELIARVQELEKQIEGWQEIGAQYGDAFETPQDIVFLIENTKQENEKKNGELEKRLEDAENQAEAWEDSHNTLKKENEELEEEVYDPNGSGEKCVDILENYRDEMEKIEEYSVKKLDKRLEDITDILPELVGLEGQFNDQQKHIGNLKKFLEEEKEKVSVFETYMNSDDGSDSIMTLINNFNEWVTNVEVKKGKNFHFQLEEDAETGEFVLKVLKDIPAKIEMWERVMESGDGDPELLLDAIAEKLNLTPIEWGKAGCGQKAAELWDKVIDTMEEI